MKSLSIILLVGLVSFTGCTRYMERSNSTVQQAVANETESKSLDRRAAEQIDPEKIVSTAAAMDRRIIRNADLTIEVNSTTEAQQRVTSIAETLGGFVVTSEAKQRENAEPAKRSVDVKLVIRVPSNQFNSALDQIQQLATNMPQRNVSGQDVTEEFIDLEARIKTQRALELQFLEIMKQANKVADALEVQRQIADVRTEIEKLEGRKHFLESKSTLSTITVTIQTPMPIVVSTSGFGRTLREAVSDSLDLAAGIVFFFVRLVILMIPIFIFLILPVGLVALYFKRRVQRIRMARELEARPVS